MWAFSSHEIGQLLVCKHGWSRTVVIMCLLKSTVISILKMESKDPVKWSLERHYRGQKQNKQTKPRIFHKTE